jgi:ABC-2 type transport system ATP-binding protein
MARHAIVRWTEQGQGGGPVRHCEERTDTPKAFVRELSTRAGLGVDGEFPGLQILRPSLEDVYLAMIGQPPAAEQAASELAENVR